MPVCFYVVRLCLWYCWWTWLFFSKFSVFSKKQVPAKESQKNYFQRDTLAFTQVFLRPHQWNQHQFLQKKSSNKIRLYGSPWIRRKIHDPFFCLGCQVISANSPMARTSSAPARPPRLVDRPRRSRKWPARRPKPRGKWHKEKPSDAGARLVSGSVFLRLLCFVLFSSCFGVEMNVKCKLDGDQWPREMPEKTYKRWLLWVLCSGQASSSSKPKVDAMAAQEVQVTWRTRFFFC